MAGRLRIRTKLLIWLFIAGALPLIGASLYSLQVVRSRVNDNLAGETDRSLRIGLNLVLSDVAQISANAVRLGRDPLLRRALRRYRKEEITDRDTLRKQVDGILAGYRERISFGEIVLLDRSDRLIIRKTLGAARRGEAPDRKAPPGGVMAKARRNRFLHTVNIVSGGSYPMIRAVAPVVDHDFSVLGTVFVQVPLDHRFAEVIRSTLGLHVGFYLARKPVASSFQDERGRPTQGLVLPSSFIDGLLAGKARVGVASQGQTEYSVGALPLVDAKQKTVGIFYVAHDRRSLEAGKLRSYRSLLLFGGGVFLLAFLIASWASRDLSGSLTLLHERAMAVAKGNLEGRIGFKPGDELGDLGQAFDDMTESLRVNQRRLGARISEIVTLHNIGRAVSSVVGLEEVLRTVVEEIRRALEAESTAILLENRHGRLAVGAAVGTVEAAAEDGESSAAAGALALAELAYQEGRALCIDDVEQGELAELAVGLSGSLMIVPLEHKGQRLGVMLVNRRPPAPAFGEAELRLLATFADQASTAIENARLYEEVTVFNERLEHMVADRTAELQRTNTELQQALVELQEAQAQLLLSERLAGLGQLVAGIAHEVNTPAAAIQGAVSNLERNTVRLLEFCRQLANLGLTVPKWNAFIDEVQAHAATTELRVSVPPAEARKQAQALTATLERSGVPEARRLARRLVDLGAADSAAKLLALTGPDDVAPLIGCLQELVMLRRNNLAISTAIGTINRIVSALRAYSHLDQTRVDRINIHDGIETTLIILGSRLQQDVKLTRRFGELPPVPVYVDELNQVWTNLIANAADAAGPKGEIRIETESRGDEVVVRIIDDGPGINENVLPRIFKPFFTTKPQGQGTGLGLGIVRRIVEKHGGRIEAESQPGRTCFSVALPLAGPPPVVEATEELGSGSARAAAAADSGPVPDADPEGETET
ncbi:MAG: ATP-binding protein [bacterium]